jgi:hypothetical protein
MDNYTRSPSENARELSEALSADLNATTREAIEPVLKEYTGKVREAFDLALQEHSERLREMFREELLRFHHETGSSATSRPG